jgi:phenylalanyl-tRNA synthetase beta chain
MRVPLRWLREYCDPDLGAAAVANRLAMTGTEVERVEHHGVGAPETCVVGRVVAAERHPDADRLSVCLVDIGDGSPSQIVCGAPNVAAGQTVAVARPGATLPDGSTLTNVRLRGVESNGMILAEDELAIGTEHDGILVLTDGAGTPGAPLDSVIQISTDVLVLEVTPNRPDCLGIYGVAREVHAATGAQLSPPPWAEDPGTSAQNDPAARSAQIDDHITITVQAPELCPRFTARVFEDVKIAPSPPWLKARLMAAGQRPISNVVDITNYVMLLTGQPLHAFDLDDVAGAQLTVRRAAQDERLETLDAQVRRLDEDMVLIADADGPTSIAGIMGGARSEVQSGTTRVLMEAANWDGANIHRTALKLGLRTEASGRFEKQLQPEQAMEAQAVAAQLMIELCGARLRPATIDLGGDGPPARTIRLREQRITSLLGAPIARERCQLILNALEFTTAPVADGLDVTVPPFRRADVTREADLIEEVARLDGLEKLPSTLPSRHGASGRLTFTQQLRRRAADALTAQGLHETVGWSFASAELTARLGLANQPVLELENPMSTEQARLRTTLLGSLLDVARHNLARGITALRLFEAGAVYVPDPGDGLPREPYHLGALLSGPVRPPTWRDPQPHPADLFAAKGVLGALLDTLRVPWSVRPVPQPFLHPGRAAAIEVVGRTVGWLGEIHPEVAAQWDIEQALASFELDLDAAAAHAIKAPAYEDLTSFPEVREDLGVVVNDSVTAAQVLDTVRRSGAPLLRGAQVFDVYRDAARLGEGNVSLALALSFRTADRTLTDEEVAERRARIAEALADELGGRVRGS